MKPKFSRKKSISLTFRGFDLNPWELESLVGVKASLIGIRGKPIKSGVMTPLLRSCVIFSIDFPKDRRLDEMFPALFAQLGGVNHLCSVRDLVRPEFFEINVVLPIKKSPEQEGGEFPPEIIKDLYLLRASLSFEFL